MARRIVSTAVILSAFVQPAFAGGSPENVLLIVDPQSPVSMQLGNHYRRARGIPDANVVYFSPNPGTYSAWRDATRPAFRGALGNSVAEIEAMIDTSVAADGTRPTGTVQLCQTTDLARSGPRHGLFPATATALAGFGVAAQHPQAVLPPAGATSIGVMTGWADPAIGTTAFTLLPGAFCDHLTSYAATFDLNSQTKMSRWIAKGASSTSGAVEEP